MSASKAARGRRTKPEPTKTTRSGRKSAEAKQQGHVCSAPGCGKVCRSASGLKSHQRQAHPEPEHESPTAAVERFLSTIDITPRLAVAAATVRQLAEALESCEPTDKAKTSKELAARINDLLADSGPGDGEGDWTEDDEA